MRLSPTVLLLLGLMLLHFLYCLLPWMSLCGACYTLTLTQSHWTAKHTGQQKTPVSCITEADDSIRQVKVFPPCKELKYNSRCL